MKFLICLTVFVCSLSTFAKELSNQSRLRRAALILTGLPPSAEDTLVAEELRGNEFEDFFQNKVTSYTESREFPTYFKSHISNLFRMYVSNSSGGFSFSLGENNAFDNLVHKVLEENLPWKNLLLSQDYEASSEVGFTAGGDILFFQFVFYE